MLHIQPPKSSTQLQGDTPLEQPLGLLLSCHEKIKHFSSALHKLTSALQQEGWTDEYNYSVDQIRRYFNIATTEHHLDEELHLFPAIMQATAQLIAKDRTDESLASTTLIQRMIKEHGESDKLWDTLDTMLAKRSDDFVALENLSRQFKADMYEHARIENDIIFPYAKSLFSEEKLREIEQEIARRRGI